MIDSANRSSRWLEAADRIGSTICRDAIWSGDRCNWMHWQQVLDPPQAGEFDHSNRQQNSSVTGTAARRSPQLIELPQVLTSWTPAYEAIGGSNSDPMRGIAIYAGTSGIALFLAHLASATRDRIHLKTLRGCVNQILRQLEAVEGKNDQWGTFSGTTGIAYALLASGCELADQRVMDRSLLLLTQVGGSCADLDVIEGAAGIVPILLWVGQQFNQPELFQAAEFLGEQLLAAAQPSEHGVSWDTAGKPNEQNSEDESSSLGDPNLTGFSHGASGIALALLRLYEADGDHRYLDTALEAIRYERHHFDQTQRNWIDHRAFGAGDSSANVRCMTAWCHGAPGILLTRLLAYELTRDPDIAAELATAIRTTTDDLLRWGAPGERDWSLCHGKAGNAEILRFTASRMRQVQADDEDVGRRSPTASARTWNPQLPAPDELRTTVEQVLDWGISHLHDNHFAWPCDLGGAGYSPTLMTGTAGVGLSYLQALKPDNGSLLALKPT